jgi:hypothetical protein
MLIYSRCILLYKYFVFGLIKFLCPMLSGYLLVTLWSTWTTLQVARSLSERNAASNLKEVRPSQDGQ